MKKFPASLKDYINVAALKAYTKTIEAEFIMLKALHEHLGLSSGKARQRQSKSTKRTGKRGPRGKVKEVVLAYLHKNQKGKAIEIAKLSGLKVASVHQSLLGLKKSGHVRKSKKRGSPFVLARK